MAKRQRRFSHLFHSVDEDERLLSVEIIESYNLIGFSYAKFLMLLYVLTYYPLY